MAEDHSPTTEPRSSRRVDLTERQRSVLRAVVEDYVLTAVPVGSKALVERYGLQVSPATVRSAMAELETLGLLSPPAHQRRPRAVRPGLPPLRRVADARGRAGPDRSS